MATKLLNQYLQPLAPFLGTWRGEFADSTPDKPKVDVVHWEAAMHGNAIRILHSVNCGEYGGETIVMWDENTKKLVYFYFTTSGFFTSGEMSAETDHYTTTEKVSGNAGGVTEVRASAHLTPDGRMSVASQYFKEGAWVEGHEITYQSAPGEEVILP